MRIATTYNGVPKNMTIEKTIELLADAGFDGIDFDDTPYESEVWQSSYKEYAKHLKNVAESFGISFTQSHAPISGALLSRLDWNKELAADRICRSIEFSALLGVPNIIVHPIQRPEHATEPERLFEENINFLSKLAACAKDNGVKIAVENMIMADLNGTYSRAGVCADPIEFKKYIDALGNDAATGCLDFGHSAIAGREPQHMLRAMGSEYITCTHIHDNDFVRDCHQLPGILKMNWEEICKSIAEIDYSGDFTLECIYFYNKLSEDMIPNAFKYMYSTAKSMVDRIEKYK